MNIEIISSVPQYVVSQCLPLSQNI